MCQPSTLQTTNEMAPACPLNPLGAANLAARGTERCDPRLETRRRSSDHTGIHAAIDRDNHRSPRLPEDGAEAMLGDLRRWHPSSRRLELVDARFHTRTTRPPVSSSRDPPGTLWGGAPTGRRASLAECADRRLTSFLAFNDARRPRRSTVHPRRLDSCGPESPRDPEILAFAMTPTARRGDVEREPTAPACGCPNGWHRAFAHCQLLPRLSSGSRVSPRRATGPRW